MTEVFLAIFIIFFSSLAYWRLDRAILLLLFCLPSYLIRFEVLGLPFNLLEAMIGIAFLVWLLFHTRFLGLFKGKYGWRDLKNNRKNRLRYPFDKELILALVLALIAVGVAGFKPEALGSWRAYFFVPALFFILVLNLFQSRADRKKVIWTLAGSCLLLSVYAIVQKMTGVGIANEMWRAEATRRVTSVFPYPNALALYLTPLTFIFLGEMFALIERYRKKRASEVLSAFVWRTRFKVLFLGVTILLSLVSIYFARSEGALLAWALGFLLFLWLLKGNWRWLAYGVVIGILGFLAINPAPREYAVEKVTLGDLSGEIRKQQWRETREMLEDGRIISGSGLHNYKEAIEPYHQDGIFFNRDKDPDFKRKILLFNKEYKKEFWQPVEIYLYPHNIFLNFWTELGFFGMLLFVWIMAKFFVKGEVLRRRIYLEGHSEEGYWVMGLIGAMATIVIHGLVDVPYFKNDLAVLFWLFIALMGIISVKFQREEYKIKKHKHEEN